MNSTEHDHLTSISPWMGIIPRSLAGRLFLLWATANVTLTLIPVFTTWLDNTEMVLNTAPPRFSIPSWRFSRTVC